VRFLAFGTYDLSTHPRFAVILAGLREHRDKIIEVNLPLGVDTAARVAMLRQPWRLPELGWRLATRWGRLAWRARRTVRTFRPDAVLVGYLGHFDIWLARLVFPRTTLVLDHLVFAADTARDRRESRRWKAALLRWIDRCALRRADVIVLDTPAHAAMLPPTLAPRAVVVPVGATRPWFVAGTHAALDRAAAARAVSGVTAPAAAARRAGGPPGGAAVRPLQVVFFGLFTPLQGAVTIGEALGLLADEPTVEVLMLGCGQDLGAARAAAAGNPRVRWRDWVDGADLPDVVAGHDVCLGIFGTGGKTRRVVPNKVYQGAAAGCAIVTADTGPQRVALGAAAYYVPAGDPAALAEALRELAHDRAEVARLGVAARQRAQASYSPGVVVGSLREHLLRPVPGGPAA
jgi:glycosyltransferase involved in cell wall biosynthesis